MLWLNPNCLRIEEMESRYQYRQTKTHLSISGSTMITVSITLAKSSACTLLSTSFSNGIQSSNSSRTSGTSPPLHLSVFFTPSIDENTMCYLLQLVYTGKSMHMSYKTESDAHEFGKEVVYKFLNSMYINWQSFLLKLSETIINEHLLKLTSEKRINSLPLCLCS